MMKRLKFLLVFVLLIMGTLTVLAYSHGKYHKSVLYQECLKYDGPSNPMRSPDILNQYNWDPMMEMPDFYCFAGPDLCVICFDNFNVTPTEARQILHSYYLTNGTLPPNGSVIVGFGGKFIWVYTKVAE